MDGRTDKWQLYFSTDDSMDGREVLDYYRTRFQLEFCFRDGKQHAGITNCQSTDFRKLDFHFNASLAAVNLAKSACKRLGITYSISSCKSFIHNAYMLERFICVFGINPDPQVIDKLFKELILFTARAAYAWLIFNELLYYKLQEKKQVLHCKVIYLLFAIYSMAYTDQRGTLRIFVRTAGISHSMKITARERANQMT